ncbi:DUF502 domain-containing protein [Aliikangiella sp. G2MR2-5]|uniref:DUF502 domain-containing protein n=1 Tax=Aliikangiella sp. G2MR2-5 TaxID=2788943 RepID=UPI0018A98BFE|nr:DUF502 domain-containing protein [Aliikangiella sp. G2MR2-5]
MNALKVFIRKSLFGGIVVLAPIIIVAFLLRWGFYFITDIIQPITDTLIVNYGLPELSADLLVILILLATCFFVGTFVTTGIGKWLHGHFDTHLARFAPGYRIVKEIISQFFGDDKDSPFTRGEVVRVQLFGAHSPVTVTGIVTDKHMDGSVTFFMPTGPNPTSGNIYHVPEDLVTYLPDAKVEQMMKSIIACGAGSADLFATNKSQS